MFSCAASLCLSTVILAQDRTVQRSDSTTASLKDLRREQIDAVQSAGRIGPLEAEYIKLIHTGTGDAAARREAIRAWRRENGRALQAEHNASRKLRPLIAGPDVDRKRKMEEKQRRAAQIDATQSAGRIGPLEAEYLRLMHAGTGVAAARREVIRAWRRENRRALQAEQKATRQLRRENTDPELDRQREREKKRRRAAQIDAMQSAGRIGPLEAGYLKLIHTVTGDAAARREAIRAWRRENRRALLAEQKAIGRHFVTPLNKKIKTTGSAVRVLQKN